MDNQIKCPHCGKSFEPTDAFKHEIEEKLRLEVAAKYEEQIKFFKDERVRLEEQKEIELEEVRKTTTDLVLKQAEERIRKELDMELTTSKEESASREKRNQELQEEVKKLLRQMMELKDAKDKIEIESQKKLLEDKDKIKQEAKKEAHEELDLKIAEKDKKLSDALKANDDLRRKLEQGSQQLQGEVQELKLEELLKQEFPFDVIKEIPKGINGADALHEVRTQSGRVCGCILWESKRTQNWSPSWISKLKDDQRQAKAEAAVLVSAVLPEGGKTFNIIDSIVVIDFRSAIGMAHLLREQLIKVHSAHTANDDKATKAEVVYNYLISNEFRQRIEVWVEFFQKRREEIDRERSYFSKKWDKEEKEIVKVMTATSGIYGDLQGLIGNALPKVNYLELAESEEIDN